MESTVNIAAFLGKRPSNFQHRRRRGVPGGSSYGDCADVEHTVYYQPAYVFSGLDQTSCDFSGLDQGYDAPTDRWFGCGTAMGKGLWERDHENRSMIQWRWEFEWDEDRDRVYDEQGSGDGSCCEASSIAVDYYQTEDWRENYFASTRILDAPVCWINNEAFLFEYIKGNVAQGYLLTPDYSLPKTYVFRHKGRKGMIFGMGSTLKRAYNDLQIKLLSEESVETRLEYFLRMFPRYYNTLYSVKDLFECHGWLTESCEGGRYEFMRDHDLTFDDEMTIDEFVRLTRDEFGGEIIERLMWMYKKDKGYS